MTGAALDGVRRAAAPDAAVHVDDDPLPWREGLHVAAVVAARGLDPAAVATALNGRFVPRAARAATPVSPGDRVTLVLPIVGG